MKSSFNRTGGRLLAGAATIALSAAALSSPAHAIVPNDNFTSEEIVDEEGDVNGVGMIITNQVGLGSIGICTGTLINPRTVLFAAHCVNDRDASDYDGENVRASVTFTVDAFPGILDWFGTGQTNTDLLVYNINQIRYDPRSLQNPQALGFIEADIAIATLDTPVGTQFDPTTNSLVSTIPTWALLFSPLPSPDEIDPVNGTGYHVNITGYGGTGSGTTGNSEGIDFRRRSAENMLGGLLSLDDRNDAFFGGDGEPFLPQNLYQLDFDDPARTDGDDTTAPDFRDLNLYRDDPLVREGITAGGDSGGPLILDAANNDLSTENLQIGVLSGGSSFFGSTGFSAYGSSSFYQPLFLYWDYIVATNPYRYVSAIAGDGSWEDPNHWQTDLDPIYRVINEAGEVVNGLPTSPGAGLNGTDPDFGEVCIQTPFFFDPAGVDTTLPTNRCENVGTGETTVDGEPASTAAVSNNRGEAVLSAGTSNAPEETEVTAGESNNRGKALVTANTSNNRGEAVVSASAGDTGAQVISGSLEQPHATSILFPIEQAQYELGPAEEQPHGPSGGPPEFADADNPDPTLDNGLPGATGFVPDNIDPVVSADPAEQVNARYFDVTLSAAGTTTLSSDVTIDRLTVVGAAGLDIQADGDLTSLIDIMQGGGTINVDGALRTSGDYLMIAGILGGTGTVQTPFFTNIVGAIAPGTMGTIGTLGIDGNAILSSGSTLMIDIGPDNTSDLLEISGGASIGGDVVVGPGIMQQVNGLGQEYTILTAAGGLDGTFNENDISAILSQSFTYTDTAVLMQILAASYRTVIDTSDPVQRAYAQLFDQNRGNSALAELYGLDFADAATIQATFEGLAPVAETAVQQLAAQSFNNLQSFNASRLRESDLASSGGTIATLGNPLRTAQMQVSRGSQPILTGALGLDQGEEPTSVREGAIREDFALYLAGGLLNGSGESMPGYTTVETDVDGYFFGGGIEYFPSESSMIGLSGYYSDLEADVVLGQEAESKMLALSIYGSAKTEDGFVIDGQVSLTDLDVDTERTVSFLGGTQTLTSASSDGGFAAALGISYDLEGPMGTLSPGIELRYVDHSFDAVTETGGSLALAIDRPDFESLQGRIGLDYQKVTGAFQLDANIDFVHEYEDGPQAFSAQFASGTGPAVLFPLANGDKNWAEAGLSAQFGAGPAMLGVGFDTTIGRQNANAQTYRATATFKF
jgi:subtilase-type serine protease